MIFITGDIHGNPVRLSSDNFPKQKEMTKDDTVIICGDFGIVWNWEGEDSSEKWWLDWLEAKPFTTVFCDGNHENFDRLNSYPVKEWNGGLVHEIRPSVLHLMRGEIFNIEGKRFFVFGGASSHDIWDGILDPKKDQEKIKQWYKEPYRMFRVNKRSWWKEELPTEEEMLNGIDNLEKCNWKVDYIISHSPSTYIIKLLLGQRLYSQDILTEYLEGIKKRLEYDKHYFGHMHVERIIEEERSIGLYANIYRIE